LIGTSTWPRGARALKSAQDSSLEGRIFNSLPVNSPMIPWPRNCCHQLSVCRSYMTRSELRSLPVVPKSSTRPSSRRSNTTAVLHSGQKVTVTGTPPIESLTISCQIRIFNG